MDCAICGMTRDEHEALAIHHAFTEEPGDLRPRQPTVKNDRSTPPMERDPRAHARADQMLLNLIGVLAQKGLLTAEDLAAVMGGKLERTGPNGDDAR